MAFAPGYKALFVLICLLICFEFGYSQTLPEGFSVREINDMLDGEALGFALLPYEQRILMIICNFRIPFVINLTSPV